MISGYDYDYDYIYIYIYIHIYIYIYIVYIYIYIPQKCPLIFLARFLWELGGVEGTPPLF